MRSTNPLGMASTLHATLFYHSYEFAASVLRLFPIIYGATLLDQ
jgi:hypothetical protein